MEADFLILADAAQVQGDKLYMLGGGWSVVWARQFPVAHPMTVAIGVLVSWQETNQRHQFRLEILSADGESKANVEGEFEMGRPPGLPAGVAQRMMIAANLALQLEGPGEFEAVLSLDGAVSKRASFSVVKRQQ
jgi:hypothetical protein